jgi:hypothetical protein
MLTNMTGSQIVLLYLFLIFLNKTINIFIYIYIYEMKKAILLKTLDYKKYLKEFYKIIFFTS